MIRLTQVSKQFSGKISVDIRDAEPDWGPYLAPKAPDGAPNVLIIAWDDLGYATMDSFGGPVQCPNMARIAERGVKLANSVEEVREHATNILGLDIKGHIVKIVWIEVGSDIAEEYYASFTLDRSRKQHLGMLSAQGGVEIEAVADGRASEKPKTANAIRIVAKTPPTMIGMSGLSDLRDWAMLFAPG